MKIVSKSGLHDLLDCSTGARVIFTEYTPSIHLSDVMVAEQDFGATDVVPIDGETFCWDWNINEYNDNDLFAVFEVSEILQMIRTLARGLPEDLLSFICNRYEDYE